ncbi:unnamed protein product [Clonostachys rosea f. rosea IK726]|uniref:Uncharacterized protein n=1 Tax=Clonostachys rosea f. rosea IK726 TaxID=1349383 RepID=A0ACA9TMX8_BIOOC|nr:unnamed protein product [Clonostachys rosea f. rosea IK726]
MASPPKQSRKSLTDLFSDLKIKPAAQNRPSSPQKRAMMNTEMRRTISRGWPSASKDSVAPVYMTIHSDGIYCQRADIQQPEELFAKAKNWLEVIQNTPHDEIQDVVTKEIQESMIRAIFGSNQIERAGLNLDITIYLCRKILNGEDVGPITERDPNYQSALLELYRRDPTLRNLPSQYVLRSHNEVIQHAKAFHFLIHTFVIEKQDLTESLIKETHRILVQGVPITDLDGPNIQPEEYGGIYRTVVVGAGTTNFIVPKFVPTKMKEMCENLKRELEDAERNKVIDPFSTASKYSLEFVQIHPFMDGNGRMCRMILNAILCRYAGVVVPIGEQGEEREEYMQIKRESSQKMEGHGDYATFVLGRATRRIREMKKKLSGKKRKA